MYHCMAHKTPSRNSLDPNQSVYVRWDSSHKVCMQDGTGLSHQHLWALTGAFSAVFIWSSIFAKYRQSQSIIIATISHSVSPPLRPRRDEE